MRITSRVATAGECAGYLSMPVMNEPVEAYTNGNRSLDEGKVRKELSENTGIMMSSDDDRDVLSFTVELLSRMRETLETYMKSSDNMRKTQKGDKKTAAERRFERGHFAFVRVDVRHRTGGLRVFLSAANPKEVVGRAEEFAGIYAQVFADNIYSLASSLREEGVIVDLIEREGCSGVFSFAQKRLERTIAKSRHANCPNRCACYCSPSKPECELFDSSNGHCLFDEPVTMD